MNKKRILFSVSLTFFLNILCLPLWTKYDYGGLARTLFNKETRLDFVYTGVLTGDEPFHFQSAPKPFNTSWSYGIDNSHRADLSLRARENWQKLSLQLKTMRKGEITMLLRGPEDRNEYGKCSTVLTDWRNLKINGVVVFTEPRSLSFQESFAKQIPVEKNDILQIEVEYRSHSFAFHEFSFLKSQNLWYLVTGNLLLFFLIYRLLSCLAKHVQGRASDALLLVAFFSGVFVPLIFVSDEVASQRENRTLAVRPELKEFLKENSNTGGGV